ncbi:MAG TPA: multiubiquitin domain-containing protein [Tepidiformaceae bacterium]|nr:multiubiquitin domain-containing protein [Tepidiformaceae bacterium]
MSLEQAVGHEEKAKFLLDIEGVLKQWDEPTITTEQVAELGAWDVSQGVILIDKDNNERTLAPGEIVEIRPGHGFSKKVRFKRG